MPASSSSKNSTPWTSVPSTWGDQGATSNGKRKISKEVDTSTTGGWGAGSNSWNTGASGWGAGSSRDTGSKAANPPAEKTNSTGWGSTSSGWGENDYSATSASPWGSGSGWGETSADDSNSGWNTTPAISGNQSSGDWGSGQKSWEDTLDTTMQVQSQTGSLSSFTFSRRIRSLLRLLRRLCCGQHLHLSVPRFKRRHRSLL